MADVYAIANREGKAKHVAVYHHHATGPSPLCGRRGARSLYQADGTRDESVTFELTPSNIHLPWCARCEAAVEEMVRAVAHV